MAASDYNIRATINAMCPSAHLGAAMPLEVGPTTIAIEGMQHVSNTVDAPDLVVGMGVMIEDEIFRLEAFSPTSITLARGCADTIPQAHDDGALVWFFQNWTGTDGQEYLDGEIIGVKALPTTVGSNTVPVEGVPPNVITFNSRQIRPYAPGNVKLNGSPWFNTATLDLASTPLAVTWAHRDRVGQHDILVSHPEASTGPEAGTTYSLRVYNTSGTLKREVLDIAGTSWDYALVDAQADFGITAGTGPAFIDAYLTLETVRDGRLSWQSYRAPFKISNEITPP